MTQANTAGTDKIDRASPLGMFSKFFGNWRGDLTGRLTAAVVALPLEGLNWVAVGLVFLTIATKLLWNRINQAILGSLVGLVVATAVASLWHLDVPTIGAIPQSLPMP